LSGPHVITNGVAGDGSLVRGFTAPLPMLLRDLAAEGSAWIAAEAHAARIRGGELELLVAAAGVWRGKARWVSRASVRLFPRDV